MARKPKGPVINIKRCTTCRPGTPMRQAIAGRKCQILCASCNRVLKEWEPPVIWVNGEPVHVSLKSEW